MTIKEQIAALRDEINHIAEARGLAIDDGEIGGIRVSIGEGHSGTGWDHRATGLPAVEIVGVADPRRGYAMVIPRKTIKATAKKAIDPVAVVDEIERRAKGLAEIRAAGRKDAAARDARRDEIADVTLPSWLHVEARADGYVISGSTSDAAMVCRIADALKEKP